MSAGQRIAILVDVQNVFYSARTLYNGKLDYSKLLRELTGDRQLVRAMAFITSRPDLNQSNFHDALRKLGFDLSIKEMKSRTNGEGRTIVRGSYQVALTVEAIAMSRKVDTIVLVTGDSEYTPLVTYLKNHGCRVELVGFEGSVSSELMQAASLQCRYVPKSWTFEIPDKKSSVRKPTSVEKYSPRVPRGLKPDEAEPYDPDDELDDEFDEPQPEVEGQPTVNDRGVLPTAVYS